MEHQKRPYVLSETHWRDVRWHDYELAVLPWGALEAHNYHLPYSTDNVETESFAYDAAGLAWEEGAKVIVLPNVPFGVNTGQLDIKLTMNINPSTQKAILGDIVQDLKNSGIPKLLIVNGHGGNDFKPMIRELGVEFPEVFISVCQWFEAVDRGKYFDNIGDHADEMETSLMMYLVPNMVLPLSEAGEGKSRKFSVSALNENWAWAERQWTRVSEDTGIGNPKLASKEKGERCYRDITEKLGQLMFNLSKTDVDELYE